MYTQSWENSKFNLKEQFQPTVLTDNEIRKATIKNTNLPYLQYMYLGDPEEPLKCLITKEHGWINRNDYGTQKNKTRFRLDFNHIRQKCNDKRTAGDSVDKSKDNPSALFRERYIDPSYKKNVYNRGYRQAERELDVFEFMCIMPILSEEHSFISQDSAKSDITLNSFPKDTWSWCLQNENNFEMTKNFLDIKIYNISYYFMINHLKDIKYTDIRKRVVELFTP